MRRNRIDAPAAGSVRRQDCSREVAARRGLLGSRRNVERCTLCLRPRGKNEDERRRLRTRFPDSPPPPGSCETCTDFLRRIPSLPAVSICARCVRHLRPALSRDLHQEVLSLEALTENLEAEVGRLKQDARELQERYELEHREVVRLRFEALGGSE